MPLFLTLIFGAITGLIGFAVGRYCDKHWGHFNSVHHWVYGLILMIGGGILFDFFIGALALWFGVGHFISDLEDFYHFRIKGADKPHVWKFWSVK